LFILFNLFLTDKGTKKFFNRNKSEKIIRIRLSNYFETELAGELVIVESFMFGCKSASQSF